MSDSDGYTQPNKSGEEDKPDNDLTRKRADVDTDIPDSELDARSTAVISKKAIQRHVHPPKNIEPDLHTRGEREVILVIRGIIERFVIPGDRKVVLGRADTRMRTVPDIDLTPYGALDRGVSREHAYIWIEEDDIYISDAGSTNGTYHNGEQLGESQSQKLARGDELLLGRLAVQILFR